MFIDKLLSSVKKLLQSNGKHDADANDVDAILSKYQEDSDGLLPMEDEGGEIESALEPDITNSVSTPEVKDDTSFTEKVKKKMKKKAQKEARDIGPENLPLSELTRLLDQNNKDMEVNLYDESGKKESVYEEEPASPPIEHLSQEQIEHYAMLEQMNAQANEDLSNIELREMQTEITTSDDLEQKDFSKKGNAPTIGGDTKESFFMRILASIEGASMRTKIILISTIGVIVAGLVISTVIISAMIPKNTAPEAIPLNTNSVTNGANYIYLNMQATLNDKMLVLQRMQADSLATVFYFNVELNNTFYEYTLIDENGKVYNMDFAFLPIDSSTPNGTRELRFEPIDEGITSFTLTVSDIKNNTSVYFDITFSTGVTYPPTKYVDKPIVISDTSEYRLELSNARFSSTGSILNFKLTHTDQSQGIKFLQGMMDDNINLYEGSSRVLPNRKDPIISQVSEDGTFLMQLSYFPLRNLETRLNIVVKNLFVSVPYGKDIDTAGLFLNTPETEIDIKIDDKTLTLERMGIGDNIAVLVMHSEKSVQAFADEQEDGEQENIEQENNGQENNGQENNEQENGEYLQPPVVDYSNRIETRLDAELIAELSPGVTLVFEPEQFSEQEGTDVVFNLGSSTRTVSSLPNENIKLRINKVYFRTEDVEMTVDLTRYRYERDSNAVNALTSVIESFNQRLLYKSGLLPASEVLGFTENASNLNTDEYTPYNVMVMPNKPLFSAQILSYSITDDKMYAIVQENWKLGIENLDVRFYRKHEVVAQKSPSTDRWTIIYDKIKK